MADSEIHTGWLLRPYREQRAIANFGRLGYDQRRTQVAQLRKAELYALQRAGKPAQYQQTRKNFRKTDDYIHLTTTERKQVAREIAQVISGWGFARLFAECIDKVHFHPVRTGKDVDEQAFEQVVSRFEQYLQNTPAADRLTYGLLIHDNNPTVAKKHTELMRAFHRKGTLWTRVRNIIETPLFVESHLTSMVQLADLCSYAIRRYLENNETELFDLVFTRAHRRLHVAVGVRHYTGVACACKICVAHRQP